MDVTLLGELSAIGWRAIVLVLIVALLGYAVLAWVHLRRMARSRGPAAGVPSGPENPAESTDRGGLAEREGTRWTIGEQQRLKNLEQDLARTREELNSLRVAFAALREDFEQRSESMSTQLKAAQHVSPIYGDAMQMALAGEAAATISERCGIARAEAELVLALVHRRESEIQAEEGSDGEQSRY